MPGAFDVADQVKIKRRLMQLVNAYDKLAEVEAARLMPEEFEKQARLRSILGQHPVFKQTYGLEQWFARGSKDDYVGKIFPRNKEPTDRSPPGVHL